MMHKEMAQQDLAYRATTVPGVQWPPTRRCELMNPGRCLPLAKLTLTLWIAPTMKPTQVGVSGMASLMLSGKLSCPSEKLAAHE